MSASHARPAPTTVRISKPEIEKRLEADSNRILTQSLIINLALEELFRRIDAGEIAFEFDSKVANYTLRHITPAASAGAKADAKKAGRDAARDGHDERPRG